MAKCVMRVIGFADGAPCPVAGQYLRTFDFEHDNGTGFGVFTDLIERAKVFDDVAAMMEYWRTVSKIRPLRPDGKPNRPLTATTVEIVRLPLNGSQKWEV